MLPPNCPALKESGPQERGIETRKQVRDNKGSSIQTLEKELLLKSSTKFDKGDDISFEDPSEDNFEDLDSVQEIELINEPITAWLEEVLENLDQEGGDDPELEGETPECVNWWSCECCHTADLIDCDGYSLNQAITKAMKDLEPLLSKRKTGHLKEDAEEKENESAFVAVDEDSEIEKLEIIIDKKGKESEEFLGVEGRYKSSLRNITDLEEQMIQADMNDETTELKLKEEIAQKTSEEDGSNHQLRDELNAKPKEVEELPGIEARHKYSLQNISDLERQLAHPDKNADLVVATTEQGDDLEDLLEENFNKYHWNFPRMVSPYDSWKYVEEVDNSGPLLDDPDVEKEDRVSPVNRVNQERKLEESPDKKIQENIKEMTAAELKLKARVKDAEENSRCIGDELDSQRRAVGMAESEKVDLMEAVATRDTEIEALQAEISKLVLGRGELARGRLELETRCVQL